MSKREVVIVLRRCVAGMLIGWPVRWMHFVRFEMKLKPRVRQLQQWMLSDTEISE